MHDCLIFSFFDCYLEKKFFLYINNSSNIIISTISLLYDDFATFIFKIRFV